MTLLQVTLCKEKSFVTARGDINYRNGQKGKKEKARMAQCTCHNRGIVTEE